MLTKSSLPLVSPACEVEIILPGDQDIPTRGRISGEGLKSEISFHLGDLLSLGVHHQDAPSHVTLLLQTCF